MIDTFTKLWLNTFKTKMQVTDVGSIKISPEAIEKGEKLTQSQSAMCVCLYHTKHRGHKEEKKTV